MEPALSAQLLLNRLRLRQVALLLEVQATGTLRAAAEQLGMTQPAATVMLKELEAAVGVRLFDRAGRGLRATAAGTAVMSHFEGLRGSMAALARELDDLRMGGGGALSVGSILAPSPTLLTRTVARIKVEQPRLRVSVLTETSDRLLDLLEQGKLDLMIGRMADGHAHHEYLFRELEGEGLSVVVGPQHPLARVRRTSLAALIEQPWILQPRESPMREVLEREFRLQGLDAPQNLVETASILTTIFLLAEAPMVAVVPSSLAARYADKNLLQVLPVRLSNQLDPYGSIVRRGRPLSAAAQRFLDLLHGA
jgi:DNA-binding transcriptional LysR family regulator